jgi:hypothetical protein
MASEFKCTKAIFIPTRIHRHELDMHDAFNHNYGYKIYTREHPLLNDIYKYVEKSSEKGKIKSFCSKAIGVGITNTYLPKYIRDIIRGNDVETTIMCCYNKDNSQPYSILLYKYDEEKNSIYIETVCADQTTVEESKGSGYLLIKNLVEAVSNTKKIAHIYLHAVPSAVSTYERNKFTKTGNTHKDDDVMVEMNMTFQIPDVYSPSGEPSSESWRNVSPEYNPHTPEYNPHTSEYNPGSPKPWSNSSPVYAPGSPKPWSNSSPVYNPGSPKPWSNSSPVYDSNETFTYGGKRGYNKTKKRNCKTKKRNCKTKKRNCKK